MTEILSLAFMQRALLAALLVGVSAPLVGTFLVQRRLSLIGDGIGHVALAGVAVGVVTGTQPVWTALVAAVGCAVLVELVRARGRTSGDTALAVMFYGGIAAGIVLISAGSSSGSRSLDGYLFGAITTTTAADVRVFAALALATLATVLALRPRLFAVAHDEEYARAQGMPVLALNVALSVLVAVTVVVSMRVVGLLLISALMIVPNAASQLLTRSFAAAQRLAVLMGVTSAVGGVLLSYRADLPSGGTIVLLTIAMFALAALGTAAYSVLAGRRHRVAHEHDHEHGDFCGHEALPHGDHVDYLHDGHRHAPHGGHYDLHCTDHEAQEPAR